MLFLIKINFFNVLRILKFTQVIRYYNDKAYGICYPKCWANMISFPILICFIIIIIIIIE